MNQNQVISQGPKFTGKPYTTAPPYPFYQWVSMMNPSNQPSSIIGRVLDTAFNPLPDIISISGTIPTFVLDSSLGNDPPSLKFSGQQNSFVIGIFPKNSQFSGNDIEGDIFRMDFYIDISNNKYTIYPAIMQNGKVFIAQNKGVRSSGNNIVIENVIPKDFANLPAQKLDLSCICPPFRLGIVIKSDPVTQPWILDTVDIRFAAKCCTKSERPISIPSSRSVASGVSKAPVNNRKTCCNDNGFPMELGSNGLPKLYNGKPRFVLPDNYELDNEMIGEAQYAEYTENINDLYTDYHPTEEWYAQNDGCAKAIGGIDPAEFFNTPAGQNTFKGEGKKSDLPKIRGEVIKEFAKDIDNHLKEDWPNKPIVDSWKMPSNKWVPIIGERIEYAFEGADIVYVPGWEMNYFLDRFLSYFNWPKSRSWNNSPLNSSAVAANPDFYDVNGYFYKVALRKWYGNMSDLNDGHIDVFLRKGWKTTPLVHPLGVSGIPKGYANRVLVVSYSVLERAEIGAESILRQVSDAMNYGTNVFDPLNPNSSVKNFGSRGLVFISQSTGSLITNIALCKAQEDVSLGASYIPRMTKLHIANQGAFRGSKLAEKLILILKAAEMYVAQNVPGLAEIKSLVADWLNNVSLFGNLSPSIKNAFIHEVFDLLSKKIADKSKLPSEILMDSTMFDLVPAVAIAKWKPLLQKAKFPTYCVVASHPTVFSPVKYIWHPGMDDGVLTTDSHAAKSFATDCTATSILNTLSGIMVTEPSGFKTIPGFQILNFDLGLAWPNGAINIYIVINPATSSGKPIDIFFQDPGPVSLPKVKFKFSMTSTGLGQIPRAIGYMIDHVDTVLQGNPALAFLNASAFSAGMTKAFSPSGMLYSHFDWLVTGKKQFSDKYFLGIGSTSDHFKATNGEFPGSPLTPPDYKDTFSNSKWWNREETFIMSDKSRLEQKYRPDGLIGITLPGENEWPVDAPIALESHFPVVQVTRECRIYLKKKNVYIIRPTVLWRRKYHLLYGWENRMSFDYVYGGLVRRP